MRVGIVARNGQYNLGERNQAHTLKKTLETVGYSANVEFIGIPSQNYRGSTGETWDADDFKGTISSKTGLDHYDYLIFTKPWMQVAYEMAGVCRLSCCYLCTIPGFISGFRTKLSRDIFDYVHDIVVQSSDSKLHLKDEVIPPAVDIEELDKLVEDLPKDVAKQFDYLWVGYTDKVKGGEEFMRLATALPDRVFCMVTSGSTRIEKVPFGVITFHNIPRKQLLEVMKMSHRLIVTSKFEAFGQIALEAMAMDLSIAAPEGTRALNDLPFVRRYKTAKELDRMVLFSTREFTKHFTLEAIGQQWRKFIKERKL